MRSATGRWVSGDDFFDRGRELRILEQRVRDGNHVLLSGQRRMGKTSIVQELGRRLAKSDGWVTLFTDVEDATCPEDVVADIARAAYPVRPILSRLGSIANIAQRAAEAVEEVGVSGFRLKIRAGLNAGNWRDHGERLVRGCAQHDHRVLLVIDELPIFLKRMLRADHGDTSRVEEFLSWLRGVFQGINGDSPVLIVSGKHRTNAAGAGSSQFPIVSTISIPFVSAPGTGKRVSLASNSSRGPHHYLFEDGVAQAVYDALGIGIPHHVQSFFVRLRDFAVMENRDRVTVADVKRVYRTGLLGPSGQNDLAHYETRLRDALDEESRSIAMEILAEAATQGVFHARLADPSRPALLPSSARRTWPHHGSSRRTGTRRLSRSARRCLSFPVAPA